MDTLTLLSNITGGMDSFGEAMQYSGAASAYKQQAGLLDLDAKSVLFSGEQQAKQVAIQGDKFIARQRALYSKAGVKFSGSPALVWAESEKNLRMDVLMTRLTAANKANAIGFEALNNRIAAGQARTRAVQSMGQGVLKIASGLALSSGGGTSMSPKQIEDYVGGK